MKKSRRLGPVLVVAAHPDDELLGCGGTLARLIREGREVTLAILGEGVTARYKKREQAEETALVALQVESRAAARVLRAKDVFFYSLPDNRFDTVPLLDVAKIVEDLVERLRPVTVFTHHQSDLNVDHGLVHRAVLTATRPVPGQPVQEVYAFEVPSSTEWGFQRLAPAFRPNVFVDVSKTLDRKLTALACYKSEMRPFPHPRSPGALRALAARWGSVAGFRAAEAFELVRSLCGPGGTA